MNRVYTFVVEPAYDLSIPKDRQPRFEAGGCAGISVVCFLLVVALESGILPIMVQNQAQGIIYLLDIAFSLGVGILSMNAFKRRELWKLREAAKKAQAQKASELTEKLTNIYQSAPGIANNLSSSLTAAAAHLKRAEREYQENAFGPFWDAVENAARNLSDFHQRLQTLSYNAKTYHDSLLARRHTFPAFPVETELIPTPAPILGKLRRLVRLGQTNYQFATIWEHYKTREVLMAGFQTLGQAIDGLEWAVNNTGVDELRTAIQRGRT
jgi:hypothetical protein